jgi:hypothetical protein
VTDNHYAFEDVDVIRRLLYPSLYRRMIWWVRNFWRSR